MEETAPVNTSENMPANNPQIHQENGVSVPAEKQEKDPPKKSLLVIGISTGILFLFLNFFLLSKGLNVIAIVTIGLIAVLVFVRKKYFFWGVLIGFLVLPLLFFGSCLLSFYYH